MWALGSVQASSALSVTALSKRAQIPPFPLGDLGLQCLGFIRWHGSLTAPFPPPEELEEKPWSWNTRKTSLTPVQTRKDTPPQWQAGEEEGNTSSSRKWRSFVYLVPHETVCVVRFMAAILIRSLCHGGRETKIQDTKAYRAWSDFSAALYFTEWVCLKHISCKSSNKPVLGYVVSPCLQNLTKPRRAIGCWGRKEGEVQQETFGIYKLHL